MLYIEDTGIIRLTRGDTARLTVDVVNVIGNTETVYPISPTDVLILSIKKSVNDQVALVQKRNTGSNTFLIEPSDTRNLPFGKYKYDVQITTSSGVYTIIEPTLFEVLTEVTTV